MLLMYKYHNTGYFKSPLHPMRYLLNICYEASISILYNDTYSLLYHILVLDKSYTNNIATQF